MQTLGAALWLGTASLFLASSENVTDVLPLVFVSAFIGLVAPSPFSVAEFDACYTRQSR